jgi:monothiol glutaredoxin
MNTEPVHDRIRRTLADHAVVLYMKGTAAQPQCGFSAAVVQILKKLDVPFHDVNVLADPDLREGIKSYSDWPTIPQLYIRGTFVGGCDITRDLYQKGELHTLLGLPSA